MMFGGRSNIQTGRGRGEPGAGPQNPAKPGRNFFENGGSTGDKTKRTDGTLRFVRTARFVLIFAPFVL